MRSVTLPAGIGQKFRKEAVSVEFGLDPPQQTAAAAARLSLAAAIALRTMDIDRAQADGSGGPRDAQCGPVRNHLRTLATTIEDHLRNPMTVLAGHAELLRNRADVLPVHQRHLLQELDDAVERLNDAVSRVCCLLHEARVRDPR